MKSKLLTLLILTLLAVGVVSFVTTPKTSATIKPLVSYCDMVRQSCHGAALQQFRDCENTGDTPANCLRLMDDFYATCTEGVGCLPENNLETVKAADTSNIDCDTVRDNCVGVWWDYISACKHTGDTPENCINLANQQLHTCCEGVGCATPIIN